MNTPALRPLQPHRNLCAAARLPAGSHAFVVTREGAFDGVVWQVGDVVVCGGAADETDAIVLVPQGVGSPILGHRVDGVLHGSRGEKCHPVRWAPAGRVRGVYRRTDRGWQRVRLSPATEGPQLRPQRARRLPAAQAQGRQLALFVPAVAA